MKLLHFSGILRSAIRLWPLPTVPRPASDISVHAQVNEWEIVSKYCAFPCYNPWSSRLYPQMQKMRDGCTFFSAFTGHDVSQSFFGCVRLVLYYSPPCGFTSSEPVKMFHFIKRRRGLRFRSQGEHRPVEKPIHKWWKGQSNPRCTSQQIRLNTCEKCSQHPPPPNLAPKLGINGQNYVNVDININIMLINGCILNDYFS